MRARALIAIVCVFGLSFAAPAGGIDLPPDGARAANVMPPGQSGHIDAAAFAQGLVTGDFGPHYADQLPLYAAFEYKPMQFNRGRAWRTLGGAVITRDAYGVPAIYARDRASLFRAFGYAQAADRLFEMEIFRRAGHGRLAELLGESYVPFDEVVRTVSEGPAARAAQLRAADPQTRADLRAFSAGVNTYIDEALLDPSALPVEFLLLADLPIEPWTPDDTLAFGEYAGRFFGEFGHAELEMAAELARLRRAHGPRLGAAMFDDLYPLDDPDAPTTIPREAGVFPRHTGRPGGGAGTVNTSAELIAAAEAAAPALARIERTVTMLRKAAGLHGFGSNQYVVQGSRTRDGHALLVSEPQTGWAVPSFFWEVELHGAGFDLRGVTVPGLAFVPIGRNRDAAWAVTSGLDANADTFVETINPDGTAYLHDGEFRRFETREEQIGCRTPPTVLLELPGTSSVCTAPVRSFTVRRTVHGPLLLPPDTERGVAFSRQSVVDGRIVSSLEAWTDATRARTVEAFARAASGVAFSFNFMYVDAAGDAAYFHVGRYPIRASDVDPRFPIPGTGPWDWQGFEAFADQPHAVNVRPGFLANWNNKPAAGWASKGLLFHTVPEGRPNISIWGPTHQVEPIQSDLAALEGGATFESMARVQRHVASVDNRARSWMPALLAAADGEPSLAPVRRLLAAWDGMRTDRDAGGFYDAPGLVIFDRCVEHALRRTFDELDATTFDVASGFPSEGHLISRDNGDTPTFKVENALFGTFTRALRGTAAVDWFGADGRDIVLADALRATVRELSAELGPDPAAWRSPVEVETYAPLGAGSVPDVAPLVNRGSYGQIVEAGRRPRAELQQ